MKYCQRESSKYCARAKDCLKVQETLRKANRCDCLDNFSKNEAKRLMERLR